MQSSRQAEEGGLTVAISTYAELQTAVENHLHRSDLTSRVPEFIALGEARINRRLRVAQQEKRATATCSTTARTLALPTDFLEMTAIALVINSVTDELFGLSPMPLERVADDSTTAPSRPSFFLIRDALEFDCIPDTAYTVRMRYIRRWDIATDSTNWLLTYHPDIYLYTALTAAEPYVKNDGRVQVWASMAAAAMDEAKRMDGRYRNVAKLMTDVPTTSSVGADIERGY